MPTSSHIICPYCGAEQPTSRACRACGGLLDPASRAATARDIGPWFLRDESRPFFPGCTGERLQRMIRDGQLTPDAIVRGPTTGGFWLPARRVPGLSRLLGLCHGCGAMVGEADEACARCGIGLGFEAPVDAPAASAEPGPPDSALELIKHAQYRQISRLQSQLRLQSIALAVCLGLLFLGGVVWVSGLLETPTAVPEDTAAATAPDRFPPEPTTEAEPSEPVVEAAEPVRPDAMEAPASPSPTEPAAPGNGSESSDVTPEKAPERPVDPAEEVRQQILDQFRDVTPGQASLLTRLGTLFDSASDRSTPLEIRREAVDEGCRLIDERVGEESDDLMRFRLIALREEFEQVRRRIEFDAANDG